MNESSKIIKVKRDENRELTDVMLENGDIIPLNHAILMAKNGEIAGVIVIRGKNGNEFLSVDPYGPISEPLNNLPRFK